MDDEEAIEQSNFELFTLPFYEAVETVIKYFFSGDDKHAFVKFQEFYKAITSGGMPKINENNFTLRLMYLLAVHMYMLATRRFSYSTKLETYACRNFFPCEIDFFNHAYVVFSESSSAGEAQEKMQLICQEHLEKIVGEMNFQIFFNDKLLRHLDFKQSFFRACVNGLKCFIQAEVANPHVIEFKRVIGGDRYQDSANALINFVRVIGQLNQHGRTHTLPETVCGLAKPMRVLFGRLRESHHSCSMIQWYEEFDRQFEDYLTCCPTPFTYHTNPVQHETFYHAPVSDGSREELAVEDEPRYTSCVDGSRMIVCFQSLGYEEDFSAYRQFETNLIKVAIQESFGQPIIGTPEWADDCMVFAIELDDESNLQVLLKCLEELEEQQCNNEGARLN